MISCNSKVKQRQPTYVLSIGALLLGFLIRGLQNYLDSSINLA